MQSNTTADAMEDAVLMRAQDLRADGCDHAVPVPKALTQARGKSAAEWAFQRVILHLKAFEEALGGDEVIAMAFSGGPSGILRIQGVGFSAPDIITFSGADEEGRALQSVQHISQLNILLRAVPRPADQPEPERIGFRLASALEKSAAAE